MFAEFLVAAALGVLNEPRIGWDAVDLRYEGKKIEVKSSAYVQSWEQRRLSRPDFDIKERLSWDAATNTYEVDPGRAADCYVFCLYTETDRSRANVLDIGKWQFYVLSAERINQELGRQQRVALSRIQSMADPSEGVGYGQLKECVDQALAAAGLA